MQERPRTRRRFEKALGRMYFLRRRRHFFDSSRIVGRSVFKIELTRYQHHGREYYSQKCTGQFVYALHCSARGLKKRASLTLLGWGSSLKLIVVVMDYSLA